MDNVCSKLEYGYGTTGTSFGRTLEFTCGCFVTFWTDDQGTFREGLACCEEHDAANQSLENLSKTHDFKISKKYIPPPPPPTMDEQLAQLRAKFPDTVAYDKDGKLLTTLADHKYGWFTVSWTMPLPKGGFNMDEVRVAFDVPPGFPASHPENYLTDPDLRLSFGGYIRNTSHGIHKAFGEPKREWKTFKQLNYDVNVQIVHGHVQMWSPNHDTLFTYAMVIKRSLWGQWIQRQDYGDDWS